MELGVVKEGCRAERDVPPYWNSSLPAKSSERSGSFFLKKKTRATARVVLRFLKVILAMTDVLGFFSTH